MLGANILGAQRVLGVQHSAPAAKDEKTDRPTHKETEGLVCLHRLKMPRDGKHQRFDLFDAQMFRHRVYMLLGSWPVVVPFGMTCGRKGCVVLRCLISIREKLHGARLVRYL